MILTLLIDFAEACEPKPYGAWWEIVYRIRDSRTEVERFVGGGGGGGGVLSVGVPPVGTVRVIG